MAEILTPAISFIDDDFYPPQATVSLSETSLENSLMTPGPTSPESSYNVKEENELGEDSKKPTKKRKSWGQELPTPKTNLPPRKRARTDDEKEQRRIERVLRNRQAAQSSRERKRQEVEKLEGEKSLIEQQNEHLKSQLLRVEHEKFQLTQQIAKMASEMEVFKHGSSVSASTTSSPQQGPSLSQHDQLIKQELDDYPFALPTPQQSLGAPSVKSFSSPSTATYSVSSTPASIGLGLEALTASPDMTQHPAAMFSLFAADLAPEDDLRLFKDGFITSSLDDDNANGFTFDSMVDLDADQSTTSFNTHSITTEDFTHDSDVYSENSLFQSSDPLSQIAATSSAQQPILGAPS
ncbi:hypothetical protein MMC28_004108 [Mycoblastus sanguinarius]|nr:hypothetical protein [Mycoblastus sanguinarius]